jgi:hypothetical protein
MKVFVGHVAKLSDNLDMRKPDPIRIFGRCGDHEKTSFDFSAVGWAGFIKPNIGDGIEADVGQTMRLFTYGVIL